jgi:23S rRNA pseudouridine2604 synthase
MRLNKYLSDSGACSRREADHWIAAGRVTLNGKRATLGAIVGLHDRVAVDGTVLPAPDNTRRPKIYLALNKPVGVTCTTERHIDGNIVDFIDHPDRIFPIGRLDRGSEGLILLTNDGDIVNKVLRAENKQEKEYLVVVDKPITPEFLRGMANGVPIHRTRTLPCQIQRINKITFRIVLVQGLNRQIRLMCEHFDYAVRQLCRVRIGRIQLGHLRTGQWRKLNPAEVQSLEASRAPIRVSPQPRRDGGGG